MEPALTVGPTQSLEEQMPLHADSRHGESDPTAPAQLTGRGFASQARRTQPVLAWALLNNASLLPKVSDSFFSWRQRNCYN